MSRHVAFMGVCQHVQCGVFERVISAGFENEWEVENHTVIIRYAVTV